MERKDSKIYRNVSEIIPSGMQTEARLPERSRAVSSTPVDAHPPQPRNDAEAHRLLLFGPDVKSFLEYLAEDTTTDGSSSKSSLPNGQRTLPGFDPEQLLTVLETTHDEAKARTDKAKFRESPHECDDPALCFEFHVSSKASDDSTCAPLAAILKGRQHLMASRNEDHNEYLPVRERLLNCPQPAHGSMKDLRQALNDRIAPKARKIKAFWRSAKHRIDDEKDSDEERRPRKYRKQRRGNACVLAMRAADATPA